MALCVLFRNEVKHSVSFVPVITKIYRKRELYVAPNNEVSGTSSFPGVF